MKGNFNNSPQSDIPQFNSPSYNRSPYSMGQGMRQPGNARARYTVPRDTIEEMIRSEEENRRRQFEELVRREAEKRGIPYEEAKRMILKYNSSQFLTGLPNEMMGEMPDDDLVGQYRRLNIKLNNAIKKIEDALIKISEAEKYVKKNYSDTESEDLIEICDAFKETDASLREQQKILREIDEKLKNNNYSKKMQRYGFSPLF